jgi:2-C-methyl-D-erythritol 4-phosphate cytidylyltransferase
MAKAVGLILAAGGVGRRFGDELPKQFAPLGMSSVLRLAANRLLARGDFARLAVTAPQGYESRTALELSALGRTFNVVTGGETRWRSVANALDALGAVDVVVVHDAARPFVTRRVLDDCLAAVAVDGAAAAALPATDTVKLADDAGLVERTLDRRRVWLVQTPQCFDYALLRDCYSRDGDWLAGATDDASLVEKLGRPVRLVTGHRQLFKLTSREDLSYSEYLLAKGRVED